MKEKGTCGSHFKIKIKNKNLVSYMDKETRERERAERFYFYFYSFSSHASLFDIQKSDRRNSSGQERIGST